MTRFFALSSKEVRWTIGCLVVLALLSADVVSGGLLTHVDSVIRGHIQPRSSPTPAWMGLPSYLGNIGIATAVLVALSLVTAQVTWRLWPLALAAANLVAVELAILVLKTAIGRPGPGVLADLGGYPGYFPSGHAATSAVCAGTGVFLLFAWASVRRLDSACLAGQLSGLLVGVVSTVRAMLLDLHWLTDGIGGLVLASVTLTLGFAAARRYVATTLRPAGLDPP